MKRYNAFNFACTWWGFCHFIVCGLLFYAIYVLISSHEPAVLKVIITLIILFSVGEIMINGTENIKKGIDKAQTANDVYDYSNENRS
jgi:hypothetical protein